MDVTSGPDPAFVPAASSRDASQDTRNLDGSAQQSCVKDRESGGFTPSLLVRKVAAKLEHAYGHAGRHSRFDLDVAAEIVAIVYAEYPYAEMLSALLDAEAKIRRMSGGGETEFRERLLNVIGGAA